MAGFTYATLTTAIQNYTETDTNVLTATITNQFIENSELRILRDIPIDAYKKQSIGNLVTGQNTINQLKVFNEALGITGLVMTKLDGTAKGGVLIGISDQFKIPVKYIGVGEKVDQLQVFNTNAFIESLFSGSSFNTN